MHKKILKEKDFLEDLAIDGENNIQVDRIETGWNILNWVRLPQDRGC
jgi:hypothetical protein